MATAPAWLNLDAILDPSVIADLAAIRAEAEALEPTVREFAIRAFRVTQSYDAALTDLHLPDEVWEIANQVSGGKETLLTIQRVMAHLVVASLEKPDD
ncbi:MAG TPA: hypothetical protein VGV63_01620, partial [Acidimicrobiales bacterium]|nr:hypothetical protein [Acidimicrobiales bacterium]